MPISNGAFSCIYFINRGTFAVIVMLISSLSIHPIGNQEPGEWECSFEAIFGQTSNAVVARNVSSQKSQTNQALRHSKLTKK